MMDKLNPGLDQVSIKYHTMLPTYVNVNIADSVLVFRQTEPKFIFKKNLLY